MRPTGNTDKKYCSRMTSLVAYDISWSAPAVSDGASPPTHDKKNLNTRVATAVRCSLVCPFFARKPARYLELTNRARCCAACLTHAAILGHTYTFRPSLLATLVRSPEEKDPKNTHLWTFAKSSCMRCMFLWHVQQLSARRKSPPPCLGKGADSEAGSCWRQRGRCGERWHALPLPAAVDKTRVAVVGNGQTAVQICITHVSGVSLSLALHINKNINCAACGVQSEILG